MWDPQTDVREGVSSQVLIPPPRRYREQRRTFVLSQTTSSEQITKQKITCFRVLVVQILICAGNTFHHHLEMRNIVRERTLLKDVSCLEEQVLDVGEELKQLLAGSSDEVAKAGNSAIFTTDTLYVHFTLVHNFI